jgi:hypothetical protein
MDCARLFYQVGLFDHHRHQVLISSDDERCSLRERHCLHQCACYGHGSFSLSALKLTRTTQLQSD